MTQRTLVGLTAAGLLVALWTAAAVLPMPYVTYEPGITVDVLGETDGQEVIQIEGQPVYRDEGQLRMTTVFISQPEATVNLLELMRDWLDPDAAVVPYSSVYDDGETTAQKQERGEQQMASSQDTAVAAALRELKIDFTTSAKVFGVTAGAPADGKLQVGDVFETINGTTVTSPDDVVYLVGSAPEGKPIDFVVRREGASVPVSVQPEVVDGKKRIGIQLGPGFVFPFPVSVDVDSSIGGPSAGLIFSIGIYDTLTPGSLTKGHAIAGTGTIDETGQVGPIGGIEQKIVAARDDGAEVFLVPTDNCAEALAASVDGISLIRVTTMHDAVQSLRAWATNPEAEVPRCTDDLT